MTAKEIKSKYSEEFYLYIIRLSLNLQAETQIPVKHKIPIGIT